MNFILFHMLFVVLSSSYDQFLLMFEPTLKLSVQFEADSGLRRRGTSGLTDTQRSPALALEIRGVETEQRTGL